MIRIPAIAVVALVSGFGAGAHQAFASTPNEAEKQVTTICVPGLTSECVEGICASVTSATEWPKTDQTTFGAAVAALIAKEANASPSAADKIQKCIAGGPNALVAAFQGAGPPPVTDIGTQNPASAQ